MDGLLHGYKKYRNICFTPVYTQHTKFGKIILVVSGKFAMVSWYLRVYACKSYIYSTVHVLFLLLKLIQNQKIT